MRTIWHSLAWKEWHEHKWKLVSIVAVLWGTAALAMFEGRRDAFGLAMGMTGLCIVPLAVFIGLGAAANERSRRTLPFLQALPTPMWPVALVKLGFGVLVLTASVLLILPLIYVLGHGLAAVGDDYRTALLHITNDTMTGNWYLDLVSSCVPLSASLFLWAAAAGVNRKDEVSAGAVALAVIVGWYLVILAGRSFLFPINTGLASVFLFLAFSTAPAGFIPASLSLHSTDESNSLWIRWLIVLITISSLTHLVLAVWYVRRFGRISNREVRSPQLALRNSLRPGWLGSPRHSPLSAIVWKQFRESGPLVLAGLVGCVGIVVALSAGATINVFHQNRFAELTIAVILSLGFGIALIVGIGVCLYDVSPNLNLFWRSRPINPDIWFWCKFVTGLLILLGALYLPLLAVIFIAHSDLRQEMISPHAMLMPLAHMAIFAAAVATTCLVRHAIYGAILSLPLLYFGVAIVWTASQMAGLVGLIERPPKFWEMTQYQVALGFAITFIASMVTAWLATRYDWGRKSRY